MSSREKAGVVVAGLLLMAGSAWAVERALNLQASAAGGMVTVSTGPMPKGLFNLKNALARTKSSLVATWSTAETECAGEAGGTVDLAGLGEFELRQQAYYNTYTMDLSSFRHTWNNHTHCDGSVHVHGCQSDRLVNLTVTLNTPGGDEWGQESATVALSASQGDDTTEGNCGGNACDGQALGACTRDCQAACNELPQKGGAQAKCHQGCHCDCATAVGCNDKNCE